MARPGRKPNPTLDEDEALRCTGIVRQVLPLRDWMSERRAAGELPAEHGNTRLHQIDVLVVMLAGFFNPMVRSLRLTEQLSELPWAAAQLGVGRVCRSTLSDALARFDPQNLRPLIERLTEQLPPLAALAGPGAVSAELRDLVGACRQILASDGSTFAAAADVVWALNQGGRGRKSAAKPADAKPADAKPADAKPADAKPEPDGGGGPDGGAPRKKPPGPSLAVRLNLQLDVDRLVPPACSVSGKDQASEAAAFVPDVVPGSLNLIDRGFVHFRYLRAVVDADGDFVVRLKADTGFAPAEPDRPLTPRDLAAGVASDRVGVLSGTGAGSRTGPPPACPVREVVVVVPPDPARGLAGYTLRLLTTLLDVPAWAIAELYRLRWQIELFLRWLKVTAGYEHLMSHNANGITTQFYVAVIACLLMQIHTGRRPSKYALFLFGEVAMGRATLEQVLPILERSERERQRDRARRAAKKAGV